MRRNRSRTRSCCNYQALESRQLLASIAFEDGEVLVRGNATDDVIQLIGDVGFQSFTVRINGDASLTETFQYSDVTKLTVFAGGGNDRVTNTLLRDSLIYGGEGNDFIQGGFKNDLLFGGNGVDTLIGRHGNDTLRGQAGVDWIYGGPGRDRLFGNDGNDSLFGGPGIDLLQGDAGSDQLRGEDDADLLYGGEGSDQLFGEAGNDQLFGQNGNDVLVGGVGVDRLEGNAGDDLLNGNGGDDTIFAGAGSDTVNGGRGADIIFGVNGTNTLNGNGDNDTIYGGAGADTINGGSGDDRLAGGSGDDQLLGDEGADELFGGSDEDILRGGRGDDFLAGQGGDDVLFGDYGENVMYGNDGDDKFVVPQNGDFISGGDGVDQIGPMFAGQFEIRLDRVGSNIRLTDLRSSSDGLWIGELVFNNIEQFEVLGEDDPVPVEPMMWKPVTQRIIVQPVVVSDNDGSNTATSLGNAEQEAEIKRRVDRIYNQAGVDVQWLPTKQWNSTFANGVGEGTRPIGEFSEIISRGDSAGIGSPDPLVVDYYFVDRVPGMEKPILSSGGRAHLGESGATQAVVEVSLASFGRDWVAKVFAHEVAHNLGLMHTDSETNPSLMSTGSSKTLSAGQIQQILASDMTRPI